ncbi:MAG TPA: hypothetical protein VEK08_17215 [Planctomycetota bacterium]|nr:hypothetical protein [Planctomycetota bacterium]
MSRLALAFCAAMLHACCLAGANTSYRLESITVPEDVRLEVGGMAFWPDGRLVMCTRRGDVWTMKDNQWKRYAWGLHEPLGLHAGANGEIWVIQRPELTHIQDTDGDGVADVFKNVCDAWGTAGDYHEFCYGPVVDREGNFWGTLNLANRGDPISKCEMGSTAPYRGWSFKITPKGEFIPVSSGLRSPNGVGMNLDGDIFCTENQGGWVGTSWLHHLSPGAFHGHPGGLRWDKTIKDLDKMTVADFDKLRKRPAICFPQGIVSSSPTEPRWDTTGGKFGPFAGQAICGDMASGKICRIALEKVGGEYQGACFPFWTGGGLGQGANRFAWAPDGTSVYIGLTSRGWGNGDGLKRLVYTGEVPMEILTMTLTKNGFDLTFTQPIDPSTADKPEAYSMQHYYYHYHAQYGSPQVDNTPVKIQEVKVSEDKKRVSLIVGELVPLRIYELQLKDVKGAGGKPLQNASAYYTLNRRIQN